MAIQVGEDEAEITMDAGDLWMGIRLLAFALGHGKVLWGVGIALAGSIGGGGALPMSMGGI